MKGTRLIVVSGLLLTAALNLSSTARAEPVAVRLVPVFDPARYAGQGAVGLLVPGVGGTVTRAAALAALERGKVRHALLGGVPSGRTLVVPSSSLGTMVTIYVALPPPGRSANDRRYPVALVGCGFRGLLTSSATRIPGLISVADVGPAVVNLRTGHCRASPLGWQAASNASARLDSLDRRLRSVGRARGWLLVGLIVAGGVAALVGKTAGVVFAAAAVAGSLVLSALGVGNFWVLVLGVVAIGSIVAALVPRRLVPAAVGALLVALLLVFLFDTQLSSLAVLGAHPEGGSRFYGVSNQLETLLLAPTLAAVASTRPPWSLALGALALATIGWSHAGADGGGIVVYGVALTVLVLRAREAPLTARRLAIAATAVIVATLLLVGIDAVLGGSSHVTRAVGGGPESLLDDFQQRMHLSYLTVTQSWGKGLEFGVGGIAVLLVIAAFLRTGPMVDAMLVAIVASLLVNDSPVDVAFLGALGCWTLVWWEAVDSRAMRRRPAAILAPFLLVSLLTAGCGAQGVTHPLPVTVVGKVNTTVSGAQVFASQGCTACHTFKPAGSTGTIGPDLDKLAQYAKQAKQPLDKFVLQSITDPNAYVQKGYPAGVMPQTYKSLPPDQLQALLKYLTKKS